MTDTKTYESAAIRCWDKNSDLLFQFDALITADGPERTARTKTYGLRISEIHHMSIETRSERFVGQVTGWLHCDDYTEITAMDSSEYLRKSVIWTHPDPRLLPDAEDA